jgi:hypothetical protein
MTATPQKLAGEKLARLSDSQRGGLRQQDFVAWTVETGELIRAGKFEQVDWIAVAEEIESLGRSDRRELKSRLEILLQHLLKGQYQPSHQSKSWLRTIREQRYRLEDLLIDSPGLRAELENPESENILSIVFDRSCKAASEETNLPLNNFPENCPYTLQQILSPDFFPESNSLNN